MSYRDKATIFVLLPLLPIGLYGIYIGLYLSTAFFVTCYMFAVIKAREVVLEEKQNILELF